MPLSVANVVKPSFLYLHYPDLFDPKLTQGWIKVNSNPLALSGSRLTQGWVKSTSYTLTQQPLPRLATNRGILSTQPFSLRLSLSQSLNRSLNSTS